MDTKASSSGSAPTHLPSSTYPATSPYSKAARSSHQYFSLRWNNYQSNMTSVFHELLESQSFVDVTLACEYNSLKAHKVVLSACSAYFQKILLDNPCKHPTIILPADICFSDLQFIIEFVYRGEIDVSEAELQLTAKKDKQSYTEMAKIFEKRSVHRRNHVEFIYVALRHIEQFGVIKDLGVYKALIDVMPKGMFIPTNFFLAEFMHYPRKQQCIINLLKQIEDNGVMPDYEMEPMLL